MLVVAAVATTAAAGCARPETIESLSYDDRFGNATTLDVYLPPGDEGGTDRPAVFLIHGGGWAGGNKANLRPLARRLARSGYVTASINYRLVPDGEYPRNIQDVWCALTWFVDQAEPFGFDPTRVAVSGYSAGGHLAALIALDPGIPEFDPDCDAAIGRPRPAIAAAIPGAGVYELRPLSWTPPVSLFLGGSAADFPERYDLASPATHISPMAPPFLIVHGTLDLFVLIGQANRMYEAMVDVGADVRFMKITGAGHVWQATTEAGLYGTGTSLNTPEAATILVDFLYETLGPP